MGSIGWGFAYGAGKGLYDVTDQRIKDNMDQRRELRAREAAMELERFKAGMRREERQEERSYLERQSEIEYGREQEQGEKERAHDIELQKLKGRQAIGLEKAKSGTTGAKKRFEIIQVENADGTTSLYQHDFVAGTMEPYQGGGEAAVSIEEIDQIVNDEAASKATWMGSDEEDFAPYKTRAEWKIARRQELMQQYGLLEGGPRVAAAATAAPTATATAPTKAAPTATRDDYAKARRNPNTLLKFLVDQGEPEDEVRAAIEKRFPDYTLKNGKYVKTKKKEQEQPKGEQGEATDQWGTIASMAKADRPIVQREPKKERYAREAPAQFAKFADLPEQQKYAVFRIYSPYWTPDQRRQARAMMPKVSKPTARASYMGL